ncbi:MAG: hypothetical protein AAF513_02210 [Pseudomonadota bacterium]
MWRTVSVAVCALCSLYVDSVAALGTDAGVSISNTATVAYEIAGAAQPPVSSTPVVTVVDELLDAVAVNDNGGNVPVSSPATGAILQFTVTNTGNGPEIYRIVAEDNVAEGGFDPSLTQLYLESNAIPGLQIGGDTAYVPGTGDPNLAEDQAQVVYVSADIGAGLSQNDIGDIALRAIAQTIINQAGTDDPDAVAWPTPGTSYAGQGDGGGAAVVGASNDTANLLIRTTGRYEVSNAVVTVVKTAPTVLDPFGGTTVVPGSVITYQLQVSVAGTGTAEALVISDVLPAEVSYVANSLLVDGVAEDDDFAPAGVDESGFDAGSSTVSVDRGDVTGGSPDVIVTFQVTVL